MLFKRFRNTTFLVLALVFFFASMATSDDAKAQDADIVAAKKVFRESTDAAKKQLQDRLNQKLEFAQRRGELELVETISKEIDALKSKGTLPTSIPTDGYITSFERALRQLGSAYDQAVRNYVRDGKLDDGRYLQEEFAKFKALPANRPTYADAEFEIKSGAGSFRELKNGAKTFSDRTYTWGEVPEDFAFKQFASVRGEGRDPIVIDVASPGLIYISLDEEHRDRVVAFLREFDWKPTEHKMLVNVKGGRPVYVFERVFEKGEHAIPRVNFSGPTVLKK